MSKSRKKVKSIGKGPKHPYYERVLGLKGIQPGAVNQVIVSHDNWCDKPKGGTCNCNPEVKRAAWHGTHAVPVTVSTAG